MELRNTDAWRMANLLVGTFVVACTILGLVPASPMWFGLIPNRLVQLGLAVLASLCIHSLAKRYVRAIAEYEPRTQIQAKRANEQIKFTANFINSIATAWVSIMALSSVLKFRNFDQYQFMMAIMVGGMMHIGAREMVANIRDEDIKE